MSDAPPVRPQTDEINRIIIGLGGQGSRVVNEVRQAVLKQGPLPAGLEFIAIDSDKLSLSNLDSVPESQRIHLAAPDDHITETMVPWLPHEFRPKAGGGCGMQRLTGKAMYLVHKARIMESVRAVARELRQRTQVSDFMVVIVNAFGGGTGSGMAIDFSLDLRADLKEMTGQEPVMFGIGILPTRAETIQRANGVAMLKELHLLLSNKEPVLVGGRDYSNPYELYFLVGREVMGIERDDDLMKSITRFTIDLGLIPSASRDHAASGKGAGWVDLQDIRTLVKGAGHMFSTFGYYRAAFPGDELIEWFGLLDRIAALRQELPSFTTDLSAQRQRLEDRQIALAHADEVWKAAKARVAKLRSNGILGANRPELALLLGELGEAEDAMRKARQEIDLAQKELPALGARRAAVEKELRELQLREEAVKSALVAPSQSRTQFTVALSEAELEYLRVNRHLLTEGNFRTIMAALGRTPEYHDRTMEVVGKNKILQLPLLNYRMSYHSASALPTSVLSAMRRHGFVRFDKAGNPIVGDDHLWMVMAMLSSLPDNVDPSKVSARAFKEVVEGHVARRAEVKIVPSASKRFEVVIHSWMIGLQVSPIAPGYPSRLRELEGLAPEYEQVVREGGLAQHHAFLYGDPHAFARLTSTPVDRTVVAETNDLVTDFWGAYTLLDAPARWSQTPPLLAEALGSVEAMAKATTEVEHALDSFRSADGTFAALGKLEAALAQATEALAHVADPGHGQGETLLARLSTAALQIERAREGPRDPDHLLNMEEMAVDGLDAVASTAARVKKLHSDLPATIGAALAQSRKEAAARDAGSTASHAVRRDHAVARVEGQAAKLDAATAAAVKHLADVERSMHRMHEAIRARARTGLGGRLRAPPAALVVDMEAGGNGNGNGNGGSHTAQTALAHVDRAAPASQEEHE